MKGHGDPHKPTAQVLEQRPLRLPGGKHISLAIDVHNWIYRRRLRHHGRLGPTTRPPGTRGLGFQDPSRRLRSRQHDRNFPICDDLKLYSFSIRAVYGAFVSIGGNVIVLHPRLRGADSDSAARCSWPAITLATITSHQTQNRIRYCTALECTILVISVTIT